MELGGDYDPPSDGQCSRIGTFVLKCRQNEYFVLTKGTLFAIVLLGGDEMANIKIQITMDEELARRVDDFADSNYMSRSGLISMATTQYLNQAQVVDFVRDMSLAVQKIAENGDIDDELREEIEDLERLS